MTEPAIDMPYVARRYLRNARDLYARSVEDHAYLDELEDRLDALDKRVGLNPITVPPPEQPESTCPTT